MEWQCGTRRWAWSLSHSAHRCGTRRSGTYNNDDAKKGGREYKKKFADLPTVDHVGGGMGPTKFKICSWRVNDSKSDLDLPEFLELCRAVLDFHESKPLSENA